MCTSTYSVVTLVDERERYIDQVLAGETLELDRHQPDTDRVARASGTCLLDNVY